MVSLVIHETRPKAVSNINPSPVRKGRVIYRTVAGEPMREYFLYVPQSCHSDRLVVLMHGISENACEQIVRFAPQAELHGAVLVAPLMRRAIYGQYQQLIDSRRGIRADIALLDILRAVRAETGLPEEPIDLFGFSGGAQFAHRFALANPRTVHACVLVAPGWYSFPDRNKPYPQGLDGIPTCDQAFDPEAARSTPFHVVIGEQDTVRDASLRRSRELDRQQGRTRFERAHRWHQEMRNWGGDPRSSLTVLPQLGHSFAEAVRQHDLPSMTLDLFDI